MQGMNVTVRACVRVYLPCVRKMVSAGPGISGSVFTSTSTPNSDSNGDDDGDQGDVNNDTHSNNYDDNDDKQIDGDDNNT